MFKPFFVFPIISVCFSFIFFSNWEPRDPGFPGNPIGNIGILFWAILRPYKAVKGHSEALRGL